MRIHSCVRRGIAVSVLVAAVGCGGGEDPDTSGFSSYASNASNNQTQTNPTTQTPSGDASSDASSDSGSSTSPVDPTTGTSNDPSVSTTEPMTATTSTTSMTSMTTMTTMTTMPMSTTTTMPMTTEPDTTSTTDDSSTTTMPMTTMPMTQNPPPKDPQPAQGLYSNCFPSEMCSGIIGNGGCLTLEDAQMVKFDGFCTLVCSSEANCTPKPNSAAVTKCLAIDAVVPPTKACFLLPRVRHRRRLSDRDVLRAGRPAGRRRQLLLVIRT
jgi:hypothetical protein